MMNERETDTRKLKPDCFYLGFHHRTGEFVHVLPPIGSVLKLDPQQIKRISLGLPIEKDLVDEKDIEMTEALEASESLQTSENSKMPPAEDVIIARLERFLEFLKHNALSPVTLTFAEKKGNSPCGGSVGGVPFDFCDL
jgi:hypothetical protein